MKIPATTIALAAFCLGIMALPTAAADRDIHTPSKEQVALQPAATVERASPNCLLPGQIRRFGNLTTVTARRPVTLAAADCAARGGEPIAGTAAD